MEKYFKAYLELSRKLRDFKNDIEGGCCAVNYLCDYTNLVISIGLPIHSLKASFLANEISAETFFRYSDKFYDLSIECQRMFMKFMERS